VHPEAVYAVFTQLAGGEDQITLPESGSHPGRGAERPGVVREESLPDSHNGGGRVEAGADVVVAEQQWCHRSSLLTVVRLLTHSRLRSCVDSSGPTSILPQDKPLASWPTARPNQSKEIKSGNSRVHDDHDRRRALLVVESRPSVWGRRSPDSLITATLGAMRSFEEAEVASRAVPEQR
jgi:hypothetical protein